ncbi:complement component 3-1-like protein [Dinothrombium tinctorium]|uniref:Complement component 3-1-like protein n=1 Tax=Dinothrombium tinctorium TaxID=1965070 RepID=A0A3S3PJQ3_9ACAR|nr:complement component 3-1-like protein [Dinothrombium tinctorium]
MSISKYYSLFSTGNLTKVKIKLQKRPTSDKAIIAVTTSEEERISVVSVKSEFGFTFVQTDKPIYTPNEKVRIRFMRLDEYLKPISDAVRLQIKLDTQKNVSFEVSEYVIPTFSIQLNSPKFIIPSTKFVNGSASAFYVYGKPVSGIITFKFGIKDAKTGKITFIGRTSVKSLINGTAKYHFSASEFLVFASFPALRNHRFVVEATVIEDATGKREKQVDDTCLFVEKPYIISFRSTYNDFKPFDETDVKFHITDASDTPVANILVLVEIKSHQYEANLTSDTNGEVSIRVKPRYGETKIEIGVSTKVADLSENEQTRSTHILNLHQSPLAYIIVQNKPNKIYSVGETYSSVIAIEGATYLFQKLQVLIVARGRIHEVKDLEEGKSFLLKIENYMKPSVRLIFSAFNNNYFIADSVKLSVSGNGCGLKMDYESGNRENKTIVNPGEKIKFVIDGAKDDQVAIRGIDEAVYALRKKDILTRAKVMRELNQMDPGCGVGGGLNPVDVILNAGLLVVGSETNEIGSHCAQTIRRREKRNAALLIRRFEGIAKNCCVLGMTEDNRRRSCQERLNILKSHMQDSKCHEAFEQCCKEATDPTARPVLDKSNANRKLLKKRSKTNYEVALPHSITTWSVDAISLSKNIGLCILETPLRIVSFKPIFIQVNLPFAVVKSEQVEMTVTVFNYDSRRLSVIVYMYGIENVCSEAEPGEKSERKKVALDPNSAKTVAFPLVPLKIGVFNIKVVSLSAFGSDVVIKKLNVIPQGLKVENDYTFQLDPKNSQSRRKRAVMTDKFRDEIDESRGIQKSQLNLTPNHLSPLIVPNSQECIISAIADRYGVTVRTALTDLNHLIRKPQGCGEQTILFMAPTLFTLKYLDSTNRLTGDQKYRAVKYISEGYQRELMFRKSDGSYSAFTSRPSSVWLTAFVMKIFCQAVPLLTTAIDPAVISSGTQWLLEKQLKDGSWQETTPVLHQKIMGGVNGQIPMTAFVSIALNECRKMKDTLGLQADFTLPLRKAEQFLISKQRDVIKLNNALIMALVAYSLTFSESSTLSLNMTDALKQVATIDDSRNFMFWRDTYDVETAGYALLAIINSGSRNSIDAQAVVNYLNTQRSFSGSFDSSQDTIVALEALAQYANLQFRLAESKVNLICNISTHSRRFKRSLQFRDENALVMQQFKADAVNEVMEFVTQGNGVGLISVKLRYNVLESPEKLCKFDIVVKVEEYRPTLVVNVDDNLTNFFDSFSPELIDALGIDKNTRTVNKHKKRSIYKRFISTLSRYFPYKTQTTTTSPLPATPSPPKSASGLVLTAKFESKFVNRERTHNTSTDSPDVKVINETDHHLNSEDNQSKFMLKLNICARYSGKSNSEMSIIDVGILSGYVPDKKDLEDIVKTKSSAVSKYEITSRSVIFYLDFVPFSRPVCIHFKIIREIVVSNIQAAIVKVYDYYQKGLFSI